MIEVKLGASSTGTEDEATHEQPWGARTKFKCGPLGKALIWAWGMWVETDWTNEQLNGHPFKSLTPEPPEQEPREDWL